MKTVNPETIKKRFEGTAPDMRAAKKRSKNSPEVIDGEALIPDHLINIGNGKLYCIKTYGCQMNEHDTEVMSGLLEMIGYTSTEVIEDADVVILNTCAVRENAENKVFGKIGSLKYLKKENPEKIFAVCGCMSQEEDVVTELLTKYNYIDLIFGTHNIHRLPTLLDDAMKAKAMVVEVWSQEGDIVENLPRERASKTKAWVNIIYGCDKFCTYCIVPYTRGKERSRMPEDILDEIRELKELDYKEVTLLGQNVNAYGKDLEGYSMANLLEDVAKIGIPRVRFTTSHPWDFDSEMIDVIAKYDNIMPHMHLPVQSGNNEILKIMGRNYTREKYLELFDELTSKIKGLSTSTDIIVGYPNETEEQFLDTLSIYDYCQYDTAFTFIYSPREGTPAAKMKDNVDIAVKKDRLQRLQEKYRYYAKQKNDAMVGQIVKVLIDGPSQKDETVLAGYSEGLKLVHFKGAENLAGQIVDVKITEAKTYNLFGELVE